MDLLDAITDGTRHPDDAEGRIYGFMYGIITDIGDPSGLGRVRARVGAMGQGDSTDWLDPMWPGSSEFECDNGQKVFVAFIDGDPNRGIFACHPTGSTTDRAKEAHVLGNTYRTKETELNNQGWAQFLVSMTVAMQAIANDPILNVICPVAANGARVFANAGIPPMQQAITKFENQADSYLSKKAKGK